MANIPDIQELILSGLRQAIQYKFNKDTVITSNTGKKNIWRRHNNSNKPVTSRPIVININRISKNTEDSAANSKANKQFKLAKTKVSYGNLNERQKRILARENQHIQQKIVPDVETELIPASYQMVSLKPTLFDITLEIPCNDYAEFIELSGLWMNYHYNHSFISFKLKYGDNLEVYIKVQLDDGLDLPDLDEIQAEKSNIYLATGNCKVYGYTSMLRDEKPLILEITNNYELKRIE